MQEARPDDLPGSPLAGSLPSPKSSPGRARLGYSAVRSADRFEQSDESIQQGSLSPRKRGCSVAPGLSTLRLDDANLRCEAPSPGHVHPFLVTWSAGEDGGICPGPGKVMTRHDLNIVSLGISRIPVSCTHCLEHIATQSCNGPPFTYFSFYFLSATGQTLHADRWDAAGFAPRCC